MKVMIPINTETEHSIQSVDGGHLVSWFNPSDILSEVDI